MRKKYIFIAAGVVIASAAAIGGGIAAVKASSISKIEKPKNEMTGDTLESLKKELDKVKVDYDDKSVTLTSDILKEKIKFSGYDNTKYEVILENYDISSEDNSQIIISLKIKSNEDNKFSEIHKIKLSGFKKPSLENPKIDISKTSTSSPDQPKIVDKETNDEKNNNPNSDEPKNNNPAIDNPKVDDTVNKINQLNKKLDEITELNYLGDKANTIIIDIDTKQITFIKPLENLELIIKKVKQKENDSTVLQVLFTIKNPTISSDESKEKTIEIPGFKSIDEELKEINKVAEKITGFSFNGNASTTFASSVKLSDIKLPVLEDASKYKILLESVNVLKEDNTKVELIFSLSFVTKPVNNKETQSIKSKPIKIIISGFLNELDAQLNKVVELSYSGNVSATEVKNIDKNLITSSSINEKFKLKILSVDEDKNDITKAKIRFSITDSVNNIDSKEKILTISGFKSRAKNLEELNKDIKKISVTSEVFPGLIKLSETADLNTIKLNFKGITDDLEVVDIVNKKSDDNKILNVTFKIKQKNQNIKSGPRTIKISGFKIKAKTAEEIEKDLKKIRTSYKGDSTKIDISDIDKDLIVFNNLPEIYEVAEIFIYSHNSVDKNRSDANIYASFKEKNETTIVTRKVPLTLNNFKAPNENVLEINKIAFDADFKYEKTPGERISEENFDVKKFTFQKFLNEKISKSYDIVVAKLKLFNLGSKIHIFVALKDKNSEAQSYFYQKKIDR